MTTTFLCVPFRFSCSNALVLMVVMHVLQEEKADEIKQKLDNLKKNEKNRQQEIKKLQKNIEDGEKLLANPPKTEDLDEIQRLMVRVLVLFC